MVAVASVACFSMAAMMLLVELDSRLSEGMARAAWWAQPHSFSRPQVFMSLSESEGSSPVMASSHSRASGTGLSPNWWPSFSGAKKRSLG